jgi:hypothetical protein
MAVASNPKAERQRVLLVGDKPAKWSNPSGLAG